MTEKVYNLFYFMQNSIITEIGVVVHELEGDDKELTKHLKDLVKTDYRICIRYSLPKNFYGLNKNGTLNHSKYKALWRLGRNLDLFEEIFKEYKAPDSPLFVITPIINGVPEFDGVRNLSSLRYTNDDILQKNGQKVIVDYLDIYMSKEGFNLPKLIHDDYFKAIKLLLRNGYYVSCMKLLVSFIDTIAYLEYGDVRDNFAMWLNAYTNLDKIGITATQLWELRNSLLHMSNYDSRKVISGREDKIGFYVSKEEYSSYDIEGIRYFNLIGLIEIIAKALTKWIKTFNDNPNKLVIFIERYDTIISDDRPVKTKK